MQHRVDWESLWSLEARKKQLPSLHGIVSRYTKELDVIGMHGGLPPSNTFPFTWFHSGLLPLSEQEDEGGDSPADAAGAVMKVEDAQLVATAQQYNMQAQGYAPLVSWARDMVISLHKPATLHGSTASTHVSTSSSTTSNQQQDHPQHHQQLQQQEHEPVGMEVVITPGASAALDSLVRVLVNPGDAVLVEEYTYAHMVEAHLLPLGCELLPVPLDAGGLVPSALDELLTARQAAGKAMPKLLYTIPTGQNPTGAVMTAERMQQVYSLARKWGLVIIEDDAYYWLQYPDGPDNVPGLNLRPGFLSLDVDGRVVRVDTLAKLLGPGFRLGWLTGPPALVAKLGLYMAGISIGASMVSQVMLHELLAKTWGRDGFEAFVKRLQAQYARQAAVAAEAAEHQLAGLAEWGPARAGMFMWFRLTGDLDSETLIEAAAANKVMVVPGHLISVAHLQAAHRRKQQQQMQAQAQLAQASPPDANAVGGVDTCQALLSQLQGVAQQMAVQQEQQQQERGACKDTQEGSSQQPEAHDLGSVASQLAIISQQLQRLQQLGNGHNAQSSSAIVSTPAAGPPVASSPCCSAGAAGGCVSGDAAAVGSDCVDSQLDHHHQNHHHAPCPFFRVSFVSVPAEAIQEGFVRLRAAILSCHGPKTPPGEESEINSCSSSIGSSCVVSSGSNAMVMIMGAIGVGAGMHPAAGHDAAAAAAATNTDSAMC